MTSLPPDFDIAVPDLVAVILRGDDDAAVAPLGYFPFQLQFEIRKFHCAQQVASAAGCERQVAVDHLPGVTDLAVKQRASLPCIICRCLPPTGGNATEQRQAKRCQFAELLFLVCCIIFLLFSYRVVRSINSVAALAAAFAASAATGRCRSLGVTTETNSMRSAAGRAPDHS